MPAMQDRDLARYNDLRAAGWAFDHRARVWRHAHTGRTGLNGHVIYECLRNHDAMPPCANSRDLTSIADRREWIRRANFLREIELRHGIVPQVLRQEQRARPQAVCGKQNRAMDPVWEA